ncbi:MAG: HAMP domain-containing histidine kinase [Clostridia bacterium]|nr:HAMP domain-containing histidine kinase [Clostridia bacterium]
MIRKLKIRFIILSMVSILVLLAVVVTGMNIINYNSVIAEAQTVLSILSKNKGSFPEFDTEKFDRFPPHISPELPYESRYFSALANADGVVAFVDTNRTASVTPETAAQYAQSVLALGREEGFLGDYRFAVTKENGFTRIIFLDCGRKLDAFRNFLFASISMSVLGLAIAFFVILFFSGKIIRPMAESYEKQKRFITDAGHEIKTPLTIITANADVLEMETGQNECIDDIKNQAARLAKLTNSLIYLAKMEEAESSMHMIEFPVSEVVSEAAAPFKTLAATLEKEVEIHIQPMLSMSGNVQALEQLVSIFMDNALKYSPKHSTVTLSLEKQGKNICLSVFNSTLAQIPQEKLEHLFERFYRADSSRNSATGGHGIGLSIAKAIVLAHGGKIHATTSDEHSLLITAVFPA